MADQPNDHRPDGFNGFDGDRSLIDPNNSYPPAGLRAFEWAAIKALAWRKPYLLARTRDAIGIRFPEAEQDDCGRYTLHEV